ncbi:hypothetical protein FPJ27_18725 [Burkholderia sp. MS455]|uniref:hypothetical protein n=1 Tax=Burkholderia TaxID=32008 RepID=UPI000A63A4DD|nr:MULTISPECIES: hypothetical protein [Burkholderia]QRR08228.1 hypothetical protein FPJ27_18725 [Burkholderia sp. MS455]
MRDLRTFAPTASAPDARIGPAACRAAIAGQTGDLSGFISCCHTPDRRAGNFSPRRISPLPDYKACRA